MNWIFWQSVVKDILMMLLTKGKVYCEYLINPQYWTNWTFKNVTQWLNWIEQPPPKGQVAGSNPAWVTILDQ
tara:strand:+ start:172 stop:387 length:216 start_codon:yes stop_codon:yes gene_type:complete